MAEDNFEKNRITLSFNTIERELNMPMIGDYARIVTHLMFGLGVTANSKRYVSLFKKKTNDLLTFFEDTVI
jgi:hypothetical protein